MSATAVAQTQEHAEAAAFRWLAKQTDVEIFRSRPCHRHARVELFIGGNLYCGGTLLECVQQAMGRQLG